MEFQEKNAFEINWPLVQVWILTLPPYKCTKIQAYLLIEENSKSLNVARVTFQNLTFFCIQVPGRMGMIITLYLITANVYNSAEAPPGRGFSYMEVWMLGAQTPILIALLEYGYILYSKKYFKPRQVKKISPSQTSYIYTQEDLDERIKKIDFVTMVVSLISFVIFTCLYWAFLWE